MVGIFTILAKLFVAGREIAIAWRYGIDVTVDSYQLALTITMWLPMMLTSVMTVVLVPMLVATEAKPDRRRLISEINGTILLGGALVALLIFFAAPTLSRILASGTEPVTLAMTAQIARAMSPIALFLIWTGYLSARLQSRERFAYTTTEAVPAVVIALAVALALPFSGTDRLVWGTIVGFALQALLLSAMVRKGDSPFGSLSLRFRSEEWKSLAASAAIMATAQVVLMASIPIDQAFAARMGAGSVATLGYASRVAILITGFGTVVLARALLPVLSRTIAEGEISLAARQARQWSGLLFVVGTVGAALVWLLADVGVRLIFERGAFTSTDTRVVAQVLRYAALQFPFYFAGLALVQWFAACKRYGTLLCVAIIALMVKVALNFLLVPSLSLVGIMISTAAMYAISAALQYVEARR